MQVSQGEQTVESLVKDFESFFQCYENVRPFLNLTPQQEKPFERTREWIRRLEQVEFAVAFFGTFSAGKSTIINALLNKEILPENTKPTTAFPTIVRKGDRDKACIYFMDEQAKFTFRGRLIANIAAAIGKDSMPNLAQFENNTELYLRKLEEAIITFEKESKTQVDRTSYGKLGILLRRWNNFQQDSVELDSLKELKNYVEEYEDSVFVEYVEVFIKEIDVPEDTILVDLPGLGVVNPRHIEFTKNYILNKAKAFVVCMKAKHLIEGEEARFIDEINKSNPSILKRSFWLINQWELLNTLEKQQEIDNFKEKTKDYFFELTAKRFFKVSALCYSLLRHLSNGTLEQSEERKKQVDTLNKLPGLNIEELRRNPDMLGIYQHECTEIREFHDFRETLFDYLNTTARKEFLSDASSDLREALSLLLGYLEPLSKKHGNTNGIEYRLRASKAKEELTRYIEKSEELVKSFVERINQVVRNSRLWTSNIQSDLTKEIDIRLSNQKIEILKTRLSDGFFNVDGNPGEIDPFIEEELDTYSLLSDKLVRSIHSNFIKDLSDLKYNLKMINRNYLPAETISEIEDQLHVRHIEMRISGLIDFLFQPYVDKKISILRKVLENYGEQKQPDWENKALEMFRNELKDFFNGYSSYIDRGLKYNIKNHSEYLKSNLLSLFKKNERSIYDTIYDNLDPSELDLEVRKQEVIKSACDKLLQHQQRL